MVQPLSRLTRAIPTRALQGRWTRPLRGRSSGSSGTWRRICLAESWASPPWPVPCVEAAAALKRYLSRAQHTLHFRCEFLLYRLWSHLQTASSGTDLGLPLCVAYLFI